MADKDLKASILTMFKKVKENIFIIYEKVGNLSRDVETIKIYNGNSKTE